MEAIFENQKQEVSFKAWVCGRTLGVVACSNPAEAMDVCLLWMLWRRGFCNGPIPRPEESYRMWRVWVWSDVIIKIQINQPTRCKSFTCLLLEVYMWLNMFRSPIRPSSEAYNCTRTPCFYRWNVVVGALLVVFCQTTTNNAQNRHKWRAVVKKVTNLGFPWNVGIFYKYLRKS
jgi:hypothetical protein